MARNHRYRREREGMALEALTIRKFMRLSAAARSRNGPNVRTREIQMLSRRDFAKLLGMDKDQPIASVMSLEERIADQIAVTIVCSDARNFAALALTLSEWDCTDWWRTPRAANAEIGFAWRSEQIEKRF